MKPGSKGLVLNRVDCRAAIVFGTDKCRETTKNVTGSPCQVSKSRMLRALSVDALCCFGAKNFQAVRKSYRSGVLHNPWGGRFRCSRYLCAVLVRGAALVNARRRKRRLEYWPQARARAVHSERVGIRGYAASLCPAQACGPPDRAEPITSEEYARCLP